MNQTPLMLPHQEDAIQRILASIEPMDISHASRPMPPLYHIGPREPLVIGNPEQMMRDLGEMLHISYESNPRWPDWMYARFIDNLNGKAIILDTEANIEWDAPWHRSHLDGVGSVNWRDLYHYNTADIEDLIPSRKGLLRPLVAGRLRPLAFVLGHLFKPLRESLERADIRFCINARTTLDYGASFVLDGVVVTDSRTKGVTAEQVQETWRRRRKQKSNPYYP